MLTVCAVVADVIVAPLKEETQNPNLEKAFVMQLGRHSNAAPIIATLQKALAPIGQAIWDKARALDKGSSIHASSTSSGKFFDDGAGPAGEKLTYGGLDHFFTGLDGFIGPPNPNLRATMQHEHCGSLDSQAPRLPRHAYPCCCHYHRLGQLARAARSQA